MIRIAVPQRHRRALVNLTNLTDDQVSELSAAVSNSSGRESDVRLLFAKVSDSELAFDSIIGMNATRLTHGIPAAVAMQQALESLDDPGEADLVPLLENRTLIRLGKTADLATATERSLHLARVLTDVRPLFDEDANKDVEAALVTQTLQLILLEEGNYTEIFVSVSLEDLRLLGRQVERALIKAQTAQRFVEKSGATIVAPVEDE